MKQESGQNAYFGLRQQLMMGRPAASAGGTSTRSTTGLFQKGTSVAALALMNAALLVSAADAQSPAAAPGAAPAPEAQAKKKKTEIADPLATQLSEVVVEGDLDRYRAETVSSPKYTENCATFRRRSPWCPRRS
jgi:hypothetical protein